MKKKIGNFQKNNKNNEKPEENTNLEEFEQMLSKFLPENLSKFVSVQAPQYAKRPKGRRYTAEFKQLCLSIYFMSPKDYRGLAQTFFLPTKRTLQRMTEDLKFSPGLQDMLFESLKLKAEHLQERDKCCVLCNDEMSLKANLFYNISRDEVIGLEDFRHKKSYVPACSAVVVMIIFNTILKLKIVNINVMALVSDMESNFVQLANTLKVTPETPFFDVEGHKVVYIFDPPHLLRATRNNLMKYSFQIQGRVTSWKHIEAFYERDKQLQCRLAPKLSDAHVYPTNLERMKVKLATQVLSATVAAGLNTYMALGALPEEAIERIFAGYFIILR